MSKRKKKSMQPGLNSRKNRGRCLRENQERAEKLALEAESLALEEQVQEELERQELQKRAAESWARWEAEKEKEKLERPTETPKQPATRKLPTRLGFFLIAALAVDPNVQRILADLTKPEEK